MFSLFQTNYRNSWGGEPKPDERDKKIAEKSVNAFDAFEGPRVGDFVILHNGQYQRFSYDWGDHIQTCDSGSFHISENGYVSMSGGLDPGFKKEQLVLLTNEKKTGNFWFFHHNDQCGSNGVGLAIECRVFKVI